MAWGWQSLTNGPFTVPAMDPEYVYKHVIILLSDGLNTQNRWYTSAASIDAREAITCTNVKATGVVIYSVQVNTGGDPTPNGAAELRHQFEQVLHADVRVADDHDVRPDRHGTFELASLAMN